MSYRLVVGLGNPGQNYLGTRHNVGFRVLDEMTVAEGPFVPDRMGPVETCRVGETRFLKPLTYMNRSGEAIRAWLDWLKLTATDLLVVVDDVSLPLGQLRFRLEGSHGGHNGLRSIEECLGTRTYARLRCGIGPVPAGYSLEGFVLGKFTSQEQVKVQEMIGAASTAFRCCQQQGIAVAMQTFNTKLKE